MFLIKGCPKGTNRQGSLLLLSLYLMLLLSALSVTALSIALTGSLMHIRDNTYGQVYYLAEAGARQALADVQRTAEEAYRLCLAEYVYDPVLRPTLSLSEDHRRHMRTRMFPVFRSRLIAQGYLGSRSIALPGLEEGVIHAHTSIPGISTSFTRVRIIVTGRIGSVVRRIDINLLVYNNSLQRDSLLFSYAALAGEGGWVLDGGTAAIEGDVYAGGGISLSHAQMHVHGGLHTGGLAAVQDGSVLDVTGEVAAGRLMASGPGTSFRAGGRVLVGHGLMLTGPDCFGQIGGDLMHPDFGTADAGVRVIKGARLEVDGDLYIEPVLRYSRLDAPLFGQEALLLQGEAFISGESAGGDNQAFYFFSDALNYTSSVFNAGYAALLPPQKAVILADYLSHPPADPADLKSYMLHIARFAGSGISLKYPERERGYGVGAILADGQALIKHNAEQFVHTPFMNPAGFFQETRRELLRATALNFASHINTTVLVPSVRAYVTYLGGRAYLNASSDTAPFLFADSGTETLFLGSGRYRGLLITQSTVHIPENASVYFEGLIAARGGIRVEGTLQMKGDPAAYSHFLQPQAALTNYLRIVSGPLILLQSLREVPPDFVY